MVDELSTLGKDEIVQSEEGTQGSWAEQILGTGFEVNQDGAPWDVFVGPDFVITDVNLLKQEFVGSPVDTIALDVVFVGHGFPKLSKKSVRTADMGEDVVARSRLRTGLITALQK